MQNAEGTSPMSGDSHEMNFVIRIMQEGES